MYRKRYSKRTIQIYLYYIKAYIRFHQYKHPKTMGDKEVEAFLTHLVSVKDVASSTQAIALNALVFLYKHILDAPIDADLSFVRSKIPPKLPVVLTPSEIVDFFNAAPERMKLPMALLYGSGLRLMECTPHMIISGIIYFHHIACPKTLKMARHAGIISIPEPYKEQ